MGPGPSASDDTRRRANLEAVLRAFGAVSRGDVDGQLAEYTDDAVLELPYAQPAASIVGKEAIAARVRPALDALELHLSITCVHPCVDPDALVLEYESTGTVRASGRPYANRYIGVFGFDGARIRLQREYYNPATTTSTPPS